MDMMRGIEKVKATAAILIRALTVSVITSLENLILSLIEARRTGDSSHTTSNYYAAGRTVAALPLRVGNVHSTMLRIRH